MQSRQQKSGRSRFLFNLPAQGRLDASLMKARGA
jgi:hypothetical protein